MKGRAYKTKVIAPAERHRHGEPSPQERNVAARARAVARVKRLAEKRKAQARSERP